MPWGELVLFLQELEPWEDLKGGRLGIVRFLVLRIPRILVLVWMPGAGWAVRTEAAAPRCLDAAERCALVPQRLCAAGVCH